MFYGCVRPQSRIRNYVILFTNKRILRLVGDVRGSAGSEDVVGMLSGVIDSVMGLDDHSNITEVQWADVLGVENTSSFVVRIVGNDHALKMSLPTETETSMMQLIEVILRAKEEALSSQFR